LTLAVGLNLLFLTDRSGGAGRYARELVPALLDAEADLKLTAFVGADAPDDFLEQPWSNRVHWERLPVRIAGKAHVLAQMTALPVIAARRHLDVVHSPANIGPLVTPRVARVVTLLDVIWLHQGEDWERGRAARAFALLSKVSSRNANRVIAISSAARDDIVSSLGLPREKIDVAPLGVRPPVGPALLSESALRRQLELGDAPLVLCVAQKRPYKNLGALIGALAEIDDPAPMLVLPGAATPHELELRSLASRLGVESRVRFLDWVSDEELEALYAAASCFVLPSLIEGFGLPVLEAMARDVPVACSNRPSLPEVAGDAALFFDPEDQSAIATCILRILTEPLLAAQLVERGRERVRTFSWRRTAEATLASYRRAIAGRPTSRTNLRFRG
jgi:glycosyltransferase involved in cell wall biosynthesis